MEEKVLCNHSHCDYQTPNSIVGAIFNGNQGDKFLILEIAKVLYIPVNELVREVDVSPSDCFPHCGKTIHIELKLKEERLTPLVGNYTSQPHGLDFLKIIWKIKMFVIALHQRKSK